MLSSLSDGIHKSSRIKLTEMDSLKIFGFVGVQEVTSCDLFLVRLNAGVEILKNLENIHDGVLMSMDLASVDVSMKTSVESISGEMSFWKLSATNHDGGGGLTMDFDSASWHGGNVRCL
jgi:hypothetical protein